MARFSLIPQEKKFFELFEAAANNTVATALALQDLINGWTDVESKVGHIDDLEHAGDTFTHGIIDQLNRTFVTPFDREDIASLAHSLDDVTDFIHAAATSMLIYKVECPNESVIELARIIVYAATEVQKAMPLLRHHPRLNEVLEHCIEINRLENMADKVYRTAMADLFDGTRDIANVIKWREILEYLESATDRCEDVSNVLEGIAIKNA